MSKRIWLHQIKLSYSQLCHNIEEETQLVGREYKHNTCMLPKSLFTLMSASFQSNRYPINAFLDRIIHSLVIDNILK
jgi:hypothetical protein